jgi:hypothetical protein
MVAGAAEPVFKAGVAERDITPTAPMPMWGYGDRHDALSEGVLDPLFAKAVVIEAGTDKIAIVGLDLGRSPRPDSMTKIREAVKKKAGVNYVMLVGSHTHHGPVIELKDEPDKGQGKFDDAVEYVTWLDDQLIDCIVEAAKKAKDARIGWGSKDVDLNRNRHTKIEPKARDTELAVIRIDDKRGNPIAILVNFAAHPTNIPAETLKFSAEYPGAMRAVVEEELGTFCAFLQGAAGDMSCKKPKEANDYQKFGALLGREVVEIARGVETTVPASPSIKCVDQDFTFKTRLDFTNAFISKSFENAFFPELAHAFMDWVGDNQIHPHLTTALINGELALVGASGEFFCNHANRLKERSRAKKTLFLGYCNGHHMYFPTIEAAAEGGYGADATVSWVELGAGEEMMNTALVNIYTMMGKYKMAEYLVIGLRVLAGLGTVMVLIGIGVIVGAVRWRRRRTRARLAAAPSAT